MNEKQCIIKAYIENSFVPKSITITEDSPESLRATDRRGESLVFWFDDNTNTVRDEFNYPDAYKAWVAGHKEQNAREQFVQSVENLLAGAEMNVSRLRYIAGERKPGGPETFESVEIIFKSGHKRVVCIECDSRAAIIKDILRGCE